MALADRHGPSDPIPAEEAEAVLATRAELGESYDAALVESFADRIEHVVEARVAERMRVDEVERKRAHLAQQSAGTRQMVLGFVSLGTGIPITAISASITDLPGLMVAWAGIVGVNVAHALQARRRD